MDKTQQIFSRILGLFLVLYGFLILAQPENYGFGLIDIQARLIAVILVFVGAYVTVRK